MKVNKKKSGIIFHSNKSKRGRKKKDLEEEQYVIGIPIIRTYRYLGIIINENMDYNDTNTMKVKALAKAKKMLIIMKY